MFYIIFLSKEAYVFKENKNIYTKLRKEQQKIIERMILLLLL